MVAHPTSRARLRRPRLVHQPCFAAQLRGWGARPPNFSRREKPCSAIAAESGSAPTRTAFERPLVPSSAWLSRIGTSPVVCPPAQQCALSTSSGSSSTERRRSSSGSCIEAPAAYDAGRAFDDGSPWSLTTQGGRSTSNEPSPSFGTLRTFQTPPPCRWATSTSETYGLRGPTPPRSLDACGRSDAGRRLGRGDARCRAQCTLSYKYA